MEATKENFIFICGYRENKKVLQKGMNNLIQGMAVEYAYEWLHRWLQSFYEDDNLEKIQTDIQDGETDCVDRIYTSYIRYICSSIDHPASSILCSYFDKYCKDKIPCGHGCHDHINRTLNVVDDYELVIGHLVLQEPVRVKLDIQLD